MNNPYVKTLEPVWKDLDYVAINEEKLQELIEKLKKGELKTPSWAVPNVHPLIDCKPALWIDFICWINTVNFAFTNFEPPYNKFTIEYPERTFWSGAFAMKASFWRAYNEGSPILSPKDYRGTKYIDPGYMNRISMKEVRKLFQSTDSWHQIPMIRERWKIFHEVGKVLLEKYNGSWGELFIKADFRAFNNGKGIVEQLVTNFPSFWDERMYKGHRLQFNKRAQLLVTMYHGRAINSGGGMPLIKDIEDIGPIADYTVPKALKFLGVLEYSPELEKAIQSHKIFQPGEPEEVENRLAMSYVMKRICDEAGITMDKADFCIWNMGRKSKEPHILVPTTDY